MIYKDPQQVYDNKAGLGGMKTHPGHVLGMMFNHFTTTVGMDRGEARWRWERDCGSGRPLGLRALYQLSGKQFSINSPDHMGSNPSSATSQLGDFE